MLEFDESFLDLLPGLSLKLGVAMLCGLLLGIERERKDKPAGVRTITLITTGAALFMVVSELIVQVVEGDPSMVRTDPSRIAAQVVTGIGFLGAGSIIQARGSVQGLTTAAVIWIAAGIGLCAGMGLPLFAFGVTLAVLLVLMAMDPLGSWVARRMPAHEIYFVADDDSLTLKTVRAFLASHQVRDDEVEMQGRGDGTVAVRAHYRARGSAVYRFLLELSRIEGVQGARPGERPPGRSRGSKSAEESL